MTEHDDKLLKTARTTHYKKWRDVLELAKQANTQLVREKLLNISDLLRSIDDDGYRP